MEKSPATSTLESAKPSFNYDELCKQFHSLKQLVVSQEKSIAVLSAKDTSLAQSRLDSLEKGLHSEKEMNASLTRENMRLVEQLDLATSALETSTALFARAKTKYKDIWPSRADECNHSMMVCSMDEINRIFHILSGKG